MYLEIVQTPQVKDSVLQDDPYFTYQFQVWVVISASNRLARNWGHENGARNWVFSWPLLRIWSFARKAHRTQEVVYLLRLVFAKNISKNTNEQVDGKDAEDTGWGGAQSFHALSQHATCPGLPHVHQLGRSQNPVLWVSMEASLSRHDWLNDWLLVINPTSRPPPLSSAVI